MGAVDWPKLKPTDEGGELLCGLTALPKLKVNGLAAPDAVPNGVGAAAGVPNVNGVAAAAGAADAAGVEVDAPPKLNVGAADGAAAANENAGALLVDAVVAAPPNEPNALVVAAGAANGFAGAGAAAFSLAPPATANDVADFSGDAGGLLLRNRADCRVGGLLGVAGGLLARGAGAGAATTDGNAFSDDAGDDSFVMP